MHNENQAITGLEYSNDGSDPISALTQFYKAFNSRDIALMEENWLHTEEASLANPLGGLRRGWSEIRPLYESLFNGPAEVYVEYYDYTIHENENFFIAVGRERGQFRLGDTEINLAIRTSRTYKRKDGTWKQLHHHGSIEDPGLLQRYQNIVFGHSQ